MTELAALGWRVWAPDMRGYGLSDKRRGYRLLADALVRSSRPATFDAERLARYADRFLIPERATDSARECDDARSERIPGASHWVLHEEPSRVVRLMRGFLAKPSAIR